MLELLEQQCSAKTSHAFQKLSELKSLITLLVVSISFFGCLVQASQAKPSQPRPSQPSIILSFPNKNCGKLFAIAPNADLNQGDVPATLFAVARGDVKVPPGTKLQFDVGNAVIDDLSFLKSLNPKPIKAVRFRLQEVEDDQFPNLSGLTECERLDLDSTDIADRGLTSLSPLKKVRFFKAARTQIRGDGFGAFKGWDELHVLLLSSNDFKPGCFKKLPRLKKVRKIDLFSTGIGDSDLADLKGMPALVELKIGKNNKITDKGMAALVAMPTLELIDLSFTSVTVEGLKKLKGLPKLRQLTVSFEKLTPLGVYHLRRALPNCQLVDTIQHTSVPLDFFKP